MDISLFDYFLKSDSVWAILFCFMFLYFLKTTRDREKERKNELKEFKKQLQEDIKLIHANMTFITTYIKIMLEKEQKRRKKNV
jgi:Na+/melibiose symporter-like transporter